ncbi:MAG TPA: helical backbone metal receptor [Burkholderiaceae bacterium]
MTASLTDAAGTIHTPVDVRAGVPRIVSLVPSVTELLCDLGLGPCLVGRTGFCIHPAPIVSGIAKIGGTKDVNIGKVRRLAPTHLIVNIDENEKPTVEQLSAFIPNVIVTHPQKPRDNLDLYRLLGSIFNARAAAEELCLAFEQEYGALTGGPVPRQRRVLYCIWKDPWMTVARNTYIGAMLDLIGWHQWQADSAVQAEHGRLRYPSFQWRPELTGMIDEVLLSSEPYRFTPEDAAELARQIGKPVRLVDGEMLSWYGSRAIAGLRYLRALVGS